MSDLNMWHDARILFHVGMRFMSAGVALLLLANLYIMGDTIAVMHLDSFAYGIAFGLTWYVPLPTAKEKADG